MDVGTGGIYHGEMLKRHALTSEERRKIIELYNQGISITAICKRFSITANTIYSIIDKAGIPRRKKHARYADIYS